MLFDIEMRTHYGELHRDHTRLRDFTKKKRQIKFCMHKYEVMHKGKSSQKIAT